MRNLVIDIGNTGTSAAIFENGKMLKLYTFKTKEFRKIKNIQEENIQNVMISSVVPSINKKTSRIIEKKFGISPIFLNYKISGIKTKYYSPNQIGADRLANVIGACSLFKPPLLIISFGTAITFNCVDKNGVFLGGLILPGVEIASRSLYYFTEKLPYIKIEKEPKNIIGKSTEENIQSGIYYGYLHLVKKLISKLKMLLGKNTKVLITGGQAKPFLKKLKYKYLPNLSLIGLNSCIEKYHLSQK